jgi:hypothetical protein
VTPTERIAVVALIVSGILTLANIAIAAWGQWINYKNRTSHLSNKLYAEQVEGCREIYKKLTEVQQRTPPLTLSLNLNSHNPANQKEIMDVILRLYSEWEESVEKWTLYLPSALNEKILAYKRAHSQFMERWPIQGGGAEEDAARKESKQELDKAFRGFVQSARRECLFTDALSQQVLESLGQRDKREVAAS